MNSILTSVARALIRASAWLVRRAYRARWREEWLAEIDAAPASFATVLRALAAPRDAVNTRYESMVVSSSSAAPRFAGLRADLLHAGRLLIRRPAHTLAVIACLSVGLITSVGTFSLVTSVIYGDMPGIAQRRELLRLYVSYDRAAGYETMSDGRRVVAERPSYSDFMIARDVDSDGALEQIGGEANLHMTAAGNHGPVSVDGAFASGDFFRTLRTVPVSGRFFTRNDDRPDAPPVAIVTEHFWRTQLDADPQAIGRPILVSGQSFTVIGVAPPRFHGMQLLDDGQDDSHGVQVWLPMAAGAAWPTRPPLNEGWITAIGRLRSGRTLPDVEQQLAGTAARIAAADPAHRAHAGIVVRPGGLGPTSSVKILALIALMLALPLTVLAIGCANVANLQLARVAEQSRELAVRLALGATRGQLVRLLTIETLARVLVATALAIAIIVALLGRLERIFPIYITLDWRALTFAISLSLVVALVTGLMPAWLVLRRASAEIKQAGRSGGAGHARLRGALVITQVALSLALLILTGLFSRTVDSMIASAPPALRQQLVARFDPAELRMTPVAARQFADAIAARTAADARIRGVSLSTERPIRFGLPAQAAGADKYGALVSMTPSWFDVMQIPLLTGRGLSASDDESVVVVSARAAELIAPEGSPLGLQVRIDEAGGTDTRARVVGVVADAPTRPTVERPDPVFYRKIPAALTGPFTLRVRAANPEAVTADLRTQISAVDPRIIWTSMRRGDMAFQDDADEMRYGVWAAGVAALVAILLSATGLYAVMSYAVQLRRREIGVRLAIGADPRRIVSMMLRQALRLVGIGILCGLALAAPMAAVMQATFVARVTAFDPVVFGPTAGLLMLVGALASIVPALRAARVDPITTLRED
jgi:putative ABC transport system permease protein